MARELIVTTGNSCEGREVAEYLGIVRGIVVRATGIGLGILGGLKSVVGGNVFLKIPFGFVPPPAGDSGIRAAKN